LGTTTATTLSTGGTIAANAGGAGSSASAGTGGTASGGDTNQTGRNGGLSAYTDGGGCAPDYVDCTDVDGFATLDGQGGPGCLFGPGSGGPGLIEITRLT
jgi:hypothetical protein